MVVPIASQLPFFAGKKVDFTDVWVFDGFCYAFVESRVPYEKVFNHCGIYSS
jgi:hypothetical protein